MTITRIIEESFELGGTQWDDFDKWVPVDGVPSYSSSAYTGTYCSSILLSGEGVFHRIDSAISQIRMAMMFKITVSAADTPSLIFLGSGDLSTLALHIYYTAATHTWSVYAGATQLGTFVLNVEDNTWRHIGVDFLVHASTGWCSVYIDGVDQLGYTGQTNQGASDFDLIGFGPISNTYDGWNSLYVDDFYADESTGEVAPATLNLKRFYPLALDGTGNYAQWHGDDGDQTNNYLRISTTSSINSLISTGLIESATSGHRDSWTLAATTASITGASVIPAVIASMWVQRRAVTGVQVKAFFRHSSTDSDSAAITPGIGYSPIGVRFPLDPSGAAWTKTVIDAMEMGIKFE